MITIQFFKEKKKTYKLKRTGILHQSNDNEHNTKMVMNKTEPTPKKQIRLIKAIYTVPQWNHEFALGFLFPHLYNFSLFYSMSWTMQEALVVISDVVVRSSHVLRIGSIIMSSWWDSFGTVAAFWVHSNALGWDAMVHMNLLAFNFGRTTSLNFQIQYHFFVSCVFRPPVLWYSVDKIL